MDERLIFDTIPEQFDAHRGRYCRALFDCLIEKTGLSAEKSVLELGPGTGQATEPILATECAYTGIELGAHLTAVLRRKYGEMPNVRIINDDFLTHDFGAERFDVIMSAAVIQWMPEQEAYAKTFSLLKPGGTLAMMFTKGDYRTPNPELFDRIQEVYKAHFHPAQPYTHGGFGYTNAPAYGFEAVESFSFVTRRTFTTDEYIAFTGTHSDHISLPEPDKTLFFSQMRKVIDSFGGTLTSEETHRLFLARKPL